MTRFFTFYDTLGEPWRFLLFLSVLGPLLWRDDAMGWSLALLLGTGRAWYLWGKR